MYLRAVRTIARPAVATPSIMPMTEVHGAQWVTFFSSHMPAAAPMTTETAISMPSEEASM